MEVIEIEVEVVIVSVQQKGKVDSLQKAAGVVKRKSQGARRGWHVLVTVSGASGKRLGIGDARSGGCLQLGVMRKHGDENVDVVTGRVSYAGGSIYGTRGARQVY